MMPEGFLACNEKILAGINLAINMIHYLERHNAQAKLPTNQFGFET